MSLFLPITKVDAAQRLVYGTISEEVPDKMGEILDYESSKPAFEEWSRQFRETSQGKSLGNVRAMHGAVAAGKLTDIRFDDAGKRIDGVAKIVDDDEWNKVLEGVYTGFSIGGGYARRWPDAENPNLMRYTPVLSEVSLVDNPAVPTATFQLIRKDGSIELRKFIPLTGDGIITGSGPEQAKQLLGGLAWLASHAEAIGANGLLAHIHALQGYLEEVDEGDDLTPLAGKSMSNTLQLTIDNLQKRIAELEAQPLPAKGALRVVGKADDRLPQGREQVKQNPADRVMDLMKTALANPIAI